MEEYFEANRAARFRGVFCDHPRVESQYSGLHISKVNHNVPLVRSGVHFIATTVRGTTGSFSVVHLSRPGPVPPNDPVVRAHDDVVTDLAFSPFDDMLIASSSADKNIRFWKLPKKGLTSDLCDPTRTLSGHAGRVNFIRFHPTVNHLLFSASADGTIRLWDVEKEASLYTADDAAGARSMSFNHVASEYLVMFDQEKDGEVRDARNKGIIATLSGTAFNHGMFLGSTHMLLTVDAEYQQAKLWDSRKTYSEVKTIELPTPPSYALAPLYDPDIKLLYLPAENNKFLTVYDVATSEPYLKPLQGYKSKSAGRAICMVPKRALNIAGCEISRILKLGTDFIEPLSFAVPRILDNFQEDLYPDTFANTESQTKEEWWEQGINKAPVLASLMKEYHDSEKLNSTVLSPNKRETDGELDEEDEFDDEDQTPLKIIQGTPFLKFGRYGAAHEKMLRLQEGRYICWDGSWLSPKLGRKCMVDLEKALRIQRGQMTTKFDRESKYFGAAKDTAFSIIYIDRREEKSIDFIAQSKEDFELWFNHIEKLLKNIRETRESTALTTRFLKFTFEMADRDKK